MDTPTPITHTEAAIEAGQMLHALAQDAHFINETPYLIIPNNCQAIFLDDRREVPERIIKTIQHSTAESFCAYFNEFAQKDSSQIFFSQHNQTFTAILDYHQPDEPNWCQHESSFTLIETTEKQNWFNKSGTAMTQEEFGLFIEQNLLDIIEPNGAEMLEIALSMRANTAIKFERATRLDNGQVSFAYHEHIDGKAGANGQLKIPESFTLGMKLYHGMEPYKIEAKLRYRIKDGNLSIWYDLVRPHKVIEANSDDAMKLIEDALMLKVYRLV